MGLREKVARLQAAGAGRDQPAAQAQAAGSGSGSLPESCGQAPADAGVPGLAAGEGGRPCLADRVKLHRELAAQAAAAGAPLQPSPAHARLRFPLPARKLAAGAAALST